MAQASGARGRARELVDQLRADWRGHAWDDVVIDDITLLSPPEQWPATIVLDYRLGGRPGRWVEAWCDNDQVLASEPLEAASGLWLALVGVRFMDLAEVPPADRPPAE